LAGGGSTAPSYRTAVAGMGSVDQVTASAGTVNYLKKATAAFPVAGTVADVSVAVGQMVTPGQVIARMNSVELAARVATAEQTLLIDRQNLASDLASQTAIPPATTTTSTPTTSTAAPRTSASSGSSGSGVGGVAANNGSAGSSGSTGSGPRPTIQGAAGAAPSTTSAVSTTVVGAPTAAGGSGRVPASGAPASSLPAQQNAVVSLQACVSALLQPGTTVQPGTTGRAGAPSGSSRTDNQIPPAERAGTTPAARTPDAAGRTPANPSGVNAAVCDEFWNSQPDNLTRQSEQELIQAEAATSSGCTLLASSTLAAPTTATSTTATATTTRSSTGAGGPSGASGTSGSPAGTSPVSTSPTTSTSRAPTGPRTRAGRPAVRHPLRRSRSPLRPLRRQ